MERRKKYYSDILIAIELIEKFISDTATFDLYVNDPKTKSAVERQLVIIGEAINNLNKIGTNNLVNSAKVIAFRNRLVHAYDSIDDNIVWVIIKKHLTPLKEEIAAKSASF